MYTLSDQYGNPQTACISPVNIKFQAMVNKYKFMKTNEPVRITACTACETKLIVRLILDNHIETCGQDEYKLTKLEMEKL